MIRTCTIAAALLLSFSSMAVAQPRTVSVLIEKMNCPTCPVTIKRALMKDSGVSAVAVHYDQQQLDVSFDDAKTTLDAILKTTADIGFPGRVLR